jgi:hypothetical protein
VLHPRPRASRLLPTCGASVHPHTLCDPPAPRSRWRAGRAGRPIPTLFEVGTSGFLKAALRSKPLPLATLSWVPPEAGRQDFDLI